MLRVERQTVKLVPLEGVPPGSVVEVGGTTLYLVYLTGTGVKSVVNLRNFCEVYLPGAELVRVMTVVQNLKVKG